MSMFMVSVRWMSQPGLWISGRISEVLFSGGRSFSLVGSSFLAGEEVWMGNFKKFRKIQISAFERSNMVVIKIEIIMQLNRISKIGVSVLN